MEHLAALEVALHTARPLLPDELDENESMRLEREQPLSFLEFNYMILQGYDFVELNKRYGCTLP